MENLLHLLLSIYINDFKQSELKQFNFNFENDALYKTDKYYSHSSKLDFIFSHSPQLKYNLSYTNEMYTPEEHELTYVKNNDMQYTSFSELAFGVNSISDNISFFTELGLGYTGKYTGGKELMAFIHSHLPAKPVFLGWDTQLNTKIMGRITSNVKYKFKLYKNNIDYIHNAGFSLSNLRSFVNTGGQLRVGILPKNFGLYTNYSNNVNYQDSTNKTSFYLFSGYNLKYTINDITLRGLDVIHPQYEYNYGIGTKYKDLSLNLIMNVESKQFKEQTSNKFGFANVLISYDF